MNPPASELRNILKDTLAMYSNPTTMLGPVLDHNVSKLEALITHSQQQLLKELLTELPEVRTTQINGKALAFSHDEEYQDGYFKGKRAYKHMVKALIEYKIKAMTPSHKQGDER